MFNKLHCFLLLLIVSSWAQAAPPIILKAETNQFVIQELDAPASTSRLRIKVKLTDFAGSERWPATAFAGFFQGDSEQNSFQFYLTRARADRSYLAAGYRILKSGQVVARRSLATVGLGGLARVDLDFVGGEVLIRFNRSEQLKVETDMTLTVPFLGVSSGKARFIVK